MKSTLNIERLTQSDLVEDLDTFAHDVLEGLSSRPKSLSSRYFYDTRGSEIFQDITRLEEYYLTGCEYEILQNNRQSISRILEESAQIAAEGDINLIELGSGDGHKTFLLIEQFQKDGLNFEYVPIDISEGALITLLEKMSEKYPQAQVRGLESEYFQGLSWLSQNNKKRSLVMFMGSNIGNFDRRGAHGFLCRLWSSLNDGDLVLTGFDLKKNVKTIVQAYDDPGGVTADFNLNLLRRINRELEGNFDLDGFEHYALYNPDLGAMESYLISSREQTVHIGALGRSFEFGVTEPIHTEFSYKYSLREIQEMARSAGFEVIENFQDERGYFVDSLWRVKK